MGPERVVGGRYRVVAKLGIGGMGIVWQARDERLHRDVALKEIRIPASVTDDERQSLGARAMAEARSAAQLDHPNVVSVFDAFEEADETWIVMQLVRGTSLDRLVRAEGPVPADRAAGIGLALLNALDAAHAAGILHRDLKPSNVLLSETGAIMLTDFSIAAALDGAGLTRTGFIMGTPGFVAPERLTSGPSGPAVDLFGLGATLFFATEGHGPFERESQLAELFATVNQPHPRADHAGPLADVIDGLLAKDPDDRWSARRARAALGPYATTPSQGMRHDEATLAQPAADAPPTVPAVVPIGPLPPPRRPVLIGIAVLAGLALLAGSVAVAVLRDRAAPPIATTAEIRLVVRADGDTARHTFTGTAGQHIFVNIVSTTLPDGCGTVQLLDPDGERLGSGCISDGKGFVDTVDLPQTGRYTVLVDPSGSATGTATVRVVDARGQQSAITPNGPALAAVIDQTGERAALTFAGTAGDRVFVDARPATLPDECGVLQLRGPDDEQVASGCVIDKKGIIDTVELPTTGTYTIIVDPRGTTVGSAQVRLNRVTDQAGVLTADAPGVQVGIDTPGQVGRFTLAGTTGQRIFVDATAATLPDQCGVLVLLDPDGERAASGCVIDGKGELARDGVVLERTGTYTLVVNPGGTGTGRVTLRLRTSAS